MQTPGRGRGASVAEERRRRREGSKRAQASRERRQEARSRRQMRSRLYLGSGVLGAIVLIVVIALLQGGGPDLGRSVTVLPGVHSPPYNYSSNPPTSGNHLPNTSPYGFLGGPIVPEAAVHNMEHGAVVIWYAPDNPTLAGDVNRLVRAVGPTCIVAGSHAGMAFPVVATIWGRTLELGAFDEAALRAFVEAYRGAEGPEAGICRQQS